MLGQKSVEYSLCDIVLLPNQNITKIIVDASAEKRDKIKLRESLLEYV